MASAFGGPSSEGVREREREEELLANFMELFGQQRIAKGRGGARRQAAAAVATFTHSMQLGRSHISYFSTPLGIAHINLSPSPPSWPLFTLHSYLKRSRTEAEAEGEEAQASGPFGVAFENVKFLILFAQAERTQKHPGVRLLSCACYHPLTPLPPSAIPAMSQLSIVRPWTRRSAGGHCF